MIRYRKGDARKICIFRLSFAPAPGQPYTWSISRLPSSTSARSLARYFFCSFFTAAVTPRPLPVRRQRL